MRLDDGRDLPIAGYGEDWEAFPSVFIRPDSGSREPLKCNVCGGTAFEVRFPQFVVTTARCIKCRQEEVVHEG